MKQAALKTTKNSTILQRTNDTFRLNANLINSRRRTQKHAKSRQNYLINKMNEITANGGAAVISGVFGFGIGVISTLCFLIFLNRNKDEN